MPTSARKGGVEDVAPYNLPTDLDSLPLEGKGDRRTAVDEVFAER